MKFLSKQNKTNLHQEEHNLPIGIPTICLNNVKPTLIKIYCPKYNREHSTFSDMFINYIF